MGAKTAPLLMATHVLFRYREPVPHVLVQSLHELHRDHLDSEIDIVLGRTQRMGKRMTVQCYSKLLVLIISLINTGKFSLN